jgi:phage terminase large subunit
MANLDFKLLQWQQKVFGDKHRFKVIAAGRRCGKSRLAAITLIIKALEAPEGSAVLYVSPTIGQSRQIIWDLLLELGRPVVKNAHVNNLDITLINGRKIYVRGADIPTPFVASLCITLFWMKQRSLRATHGKRLFVHRCQIVRAMLCLSAPLTNVIGSMTFTS